MSFVLSSPIPFLSVYREETRNMDILASIARLEKRIEMTEKRTEDAEKRADVAEKDVTRMVHVLNEHTEKIKELELKDRINTQEIEALKEKDRNNTKEIEALKANYRNKTIGTGVSYMPCQIEELRNKDAIRTKEIEELKNSLAKEISEQIGELGAAAGSCMKPAVGKQRILLNLHRGSPNHVTFSPDNNVYFKHDWSTVAAPDFVVRKGAKVMFEVKMKWSGGRSVFVGWATSGFAPSNNARVGLMSVGLCEHSWCFSALHGNKRHNSNLEPWGATQECKGDGRHHILGVALDMVRGQMLYRIACPVG